MNADPLWRLLPAFGGAFSRISRVMQHTVLVQLA
jgi:hypothetical protein